MRQREEWGEEVIVDGKSSVQVNKVVEKQEIYRDENKNQRVKASR